MVVYHKSSKMGQSCDPPDFVTVAKKTKGLLWVWSTSFTSILWRKR